MNSAVHFVFFKSSLFMALVTEVADAIGPGLAEDGGPDAAEVRPAHHLGGFGGSRGCIISLLGWLFIGDDFLTVEGYVTLGWFAGRTNHVCSSRYGWYVQKLCLRLHFCPAAPAPASARDADAAEHLICIVIRSQFCPFQLTFDAFYHHGK